LRGCFWGAIVGIVFFGVVAALWIDKVWIPQVTEHCHEKGGEVRWLKQFDYLCLSPDGRVLR
jgi:hypothetical protein